MFSSIVFNSSISYVETMCVRVSVCVCGFTENVVVKKKYFGTPSGLGSITPYNKIISCLKAIAN